MFIENLKLALAKQKLSYISARSTIYYEGGGTEYVLGIKTDKDTIDHIFYLVFVSKEELARGDFDYSSEEGDLLIFSMPIIEVKVESPKELTVEEARSLDELIFTKTDEIQKKAGNLRNLYLCVHQNADSMSINLDSEWTRVSNLSKLTNDIVYGASQYARLADLSAKAFSDIKG